MENWKDIKGYEGLYQVSNLGRVRSLDFEWKAYNGKALCKFKNKGKILKGNQTGVRRNYLAVNLHNHTIKIHRLVAKAFVPNPNNYPEVNHIDGNTFNNNADNLEWVTSSQNVTHAVRTGLSRTGERKNNHKLSKEQVEQIRCEYICGDKECGAKPLARKYGVSHSTITNIVQRKKWKSV